MRKLIFFIAAIILLISSNSIAQVTITTDGSNGDGSAILDIKSTTKGFLPPRMSQTERDAIVMPAEGLMIYILEDYEWQIYNGSSWVNIDGSSCAPEPPDTIFGNTFFEPNAVDQLYSITPLTGPYYYTWAVTEDATITGGQGTTNILVNFSATAGNVSVRVENGCGNSEYKNLAVRPINIGDTLQGGIVAYILKNGDPGFVFGEAHGLIAAVGDQGTFIRWWIGDFSNSGITGTTIGSGSANTTAIINSPGATGDYAAKVCRDYRGGGYSDWFLPSKDELNKLYEMHVLGFGGFDQRTYWSSSEALGKIVLVWEQRFVDGQQEDMFIDVSFHVRACRYF